MFLTKNRAELFLLYTTLAHYYIHKNDTLTIVNKILGIHFS